MIMQIFQEGILMTRATLAVWREYLENICPFNKIDVVTGRLTALLRGHLNNRHLRSHNEPETAQLKKMRDDHRHHAIDAITIAMTSRSILQKYPALLGKQKNYSIDCL